VTKPTDRETILYAFAVEANHDRNTLERYLRGFPELAEDLIDLTSELMLSEALGPSPADVADTDTEAAWQEFFACGPQETCVAQAPNPFARFKGQAFADLADAVRVPRSFLTPFRDGLVAAPTRWEPLLTPFRRICRPHSRGTWPGRSSQRGSHHTKARRPFESSLIAPR